MKIKKISIGQNYRSKIVVSSVPPQPYPVRTTNVSYTRQIRCIRLHASMDPQIALKLTAAATVRGNVVKDHTFYE